MGSRFFLTIVIAAIMTFVVTLCLLTCPTKQKISVPNKFYNQSQPVDTKQLKDVVNQPVPVKPVPKSVKTVTKPKDKYEKKVSDTIYAPVKSDTKSVQESVKQSTNVPAQSEVFKEESTNDIVITTEYKMASPAKYFFK